MTRSSTRGHFADWEEGGRAGRELSVSVSRPLNSAGPGHGVRGPHYWWWLGLNSLAPGCRVAASPSPPHRPAKGARGLAHETAALGAGGGRVREAGR